MILVYETRKRFSGIVKSDRGPAMRPSGRTEIGIGTELHEPKLFSLNVRFLVGRLSDKNNQDSDNESKHCPETQPPPGLE